MSYAMLALANNSKDALLDTNTLIEFANTTFGAFFKHFVSENVTTAFGGQAYQPIGSQLPANLRPANDTNNTTQDALPYNVTVTLHVPVAQLVMAPAAVFLCLDLLVFLLLTTIVIYTSHRQNFKALPRDVDTLASALAFVYASDRLLEWVREPMVA